MLDTILFYSFALLTLAGAILTVSLRNAVHCAIALITSLAGVAGLFLLQKAEFLFAVQIVLYIGGITVLFLFVIMLVNLDQTAHQARYHRHWLLPVLATAGAGALFVAFLTRGRDLLALPAPHAAEAAGNVERLADMLFRDYLVPFEVASLLLLVAIVGSVMMAKKRV
ncbi:MAG: NADH-quinone oxidoreductase subunit J [Bryobacteraceae bacterium]|jgi:NADH-quinone oxidoreductase subunit J